MHIPKIVIFVLLFLPLNGVASMERIISDHVKAHGDCDAERCTMVAKIDSGQLIIQYTSWKEGRYRRLSFGEFFCGQGLGVYGTDNGTEHISFGTLIVNEEAQDAYNKEMHQSDALWLHWNFILNQRLSELAEKIKRGVLEQVPVYTPPICTEDSTQPAAPAAGSS